jgi:hypothetical protein
MLLTEQGNTKTDLIFQEKPNATNPAGLFFLANTISPVGSS